ncbi:FimV/HubP family polar landmark protein, partial [Vibrio gallaecicus]
MCQFFKQWLMPLALIIATQISVVHADTIRVVGPNGQIQSAPTFSEPVQRTQQTAASNQASEPSRFYGPTNGSETLWSIASKLRPANSVSVQQTLLAIYQLNPQAFENQNIHSLLPSSNLRVPSLEQVRSSSTQQAVRIMDSHLAKLNTPATSPAPITVPVPPVKSVTSPTAPAVTSSATPKVQTAPSRSQSTGSKKMNVLEQQLEVSESELLALEEKNHQLRLMLSNVQLEVDGLKDELSDEDRIRNEVEKLLSEERQKIAETQKMAPSPMDDFLSNGWIVAALAIIPGALIGLIVVLLLGRKSSKEDDQQPEQKTEQQPQIQDEMAPIAAGDDMESLDDDLDLSDELFGDDDDAEALFSDEPSNEEDDVFAGLSDDDLDFNLDGEDGDDPFAGIGDDGDLDAGFDDLDSATGISVNGEDKALGLEEMERSLDENPVDPLEDSEGDFDLSDDSAMSMDDIEALLSEEAPVEDLGSDSLDQSMLDDLLSGAGDDDDDDFDIDALISDQQADTSPVEDTASDDFDIDALLAEQQSDATVPEGAASERLDSDDLASNDLASNDLASDDFDIDALISEQQDAPAVSAEDDIDDIFAQVEAETNAAKPAADEFDLGAADLASDDDIDSILSQFNEPVLEESSLDEAEDVPVSSAETAADYGLENTELLDELLDGNDLDLSDSTDLLDDVLNEPEVTSEDDEYDPLAELEELSGLSDEESVDEVSIDEDSTDTLEELLSENSDEADDFNLEDDSTDLLDDFLSESSDDDIPSISLDSDETLDELLGDDLTDGGSEDAGSLDPFDDLIGSDIEDSEPLDIDLEEESKPTEQPESSSAELELPEELEAETLKSEELSLDDDSEDDIEFNSEEFIDDLFEVAPQADPLLDDTIEPSSETVTNDINSIDDLDLDGADLESPESP